MLLRSPSNGANQPLAMSEVASKEASEPCTTDKAHQQAQVVRSAEEVERERRRAEEAQAAQSEVAALCT